MTDENAASIRDRSASEARAAESENAELRMCLRMLVGHFEFAAAIYAPGSTARANAHQAIGEAKALLARKRT